MTSDTNSTPHINVSDRREIPWLNVLKLICALMIVHIHVDAPYREYILPVCDIAVPVFFMISGYFLTDSRGMFDLSRIRRSIWKILKIILFAQLLYILVCLYSGYRHGKDPASILLNEQNWLEMVTLGSWPSEPLWYLTAFLEALAVILLISRFRPMEKMKDLAILITVTLIAQVLICYLIIGPEVTDENRYLAHTFLWPALPCIAIGSIIRRKGTTPDSKFLAAVIIILIPVIYLIDYNSEITGGRMHIPSQTAAVAIASIVFMAFLKMRREPPIVWHIASLGRKHSRNIYIVHSALALVILNALPWLPEAFIAGTTFVVALMISAGWNMTQRVKSRLFFWRRGARTSAG